MMVCARQRWHCFLALAFVLLIAACSGDPLAPREAVGGTVPQYRIGPLDTVQVFVWRSPELSATVPVRPDGRVSLPLVPDIVASGKTSTELAAEITNRLKTYVQNPVVSVMVNSFSGGPYDQQVRVMGEVLRPTAVSYRAHMTVMDVLIEVGGLTPTAAGNRAILVRNENSGRKNYRLRLDDLTKDADISANAEVLPGDAIIVPTSWF